MCRDMKVLYICKAYWEIENEKKGNSHALVLRHVLYIALPLLLRRPAKVKSFVVQAGQVIFGFQVRQQSGKIVPNKGVITMRGARPAI
ncbi:hypothetical protein EW026_g6337 [Hermanssonia centrifuga]|uniref:Uncharacterized protein n=1 Tax=Hermanssonia centrifuga TaxID=98765 RepID=A0A4S4KBB8_9APHY|nr:hypothetical protein EW026_g6337 [Hermanssonia centrifuga]